MDSLTLNELITLFLIAAGVLAALITLYINLPPRKKQKDEAFIHEAVLKLLDNANITPDQKDEATPSLTETVKALLAEKGESDAPEGIDEALACLEQGNTGKAEDIFQKILATKEAEGQQANKEAAQAAKHIGALAYLHDTEKALAAYNKATELVPDDAEAWNEFGKLLMRKGDLSVAKGPSTKFWAWVTPRLTREPLSPPPATSASSP